MVENAARNETSSMVAFPVYVLAQELQLFGPTEDGYINLYRAIRDLPGNWFLKNFNPWQKNGKFCQIEFGYIWQNEASRRKLLFRLERSSFLPTQKIWTGCKIMRRPCKTIFWSSNRLRIIFSTGQVVCAHERATHTIFMVFDSKIFDNQKKKTKRKRNFQSGTQKWSAKRNSTKLSGEKKKERKTV